MDRHDFIKTLAEACQKTGWQVHAFCLMANHFHLVVETPQPNLSEGMKSPTPQQLPLEQLPRLPVRGAPTLVASGPGAG